MFGKGNPKKIRNIVMTIVGSVCLLSIVVILGVQLYYKDRWYPNTTVDGVDLSNKKYEAGVKLVEEYVSGYKLQIKGREDGSLVIDSNSILLSCNYENVLKDLYETQKKKNLFLSLGKKDLEVQFEVQYDKNLLDEMIENSELIIGSENYKIRKPKSAYVAYSEKAGYGEIIPEDPGNKIVLEELKRLVYGALQVMENEVDLTSEENDPIIYKKPKYISTDEVMQDEIKTYNSYLLNWIEWDMGEGVKETITPEDIKEWLSISSKAKVKLDVEAMSAWIEEFCLKYKTEGKARSLTTHDGQKIKVSGGDYGWRLNYSKIVKQVKKAIKKEEDPELLQKYMEDPSEATRKELTTNLEPEFLNTAFKMDYEHTGEDWDTENYSEVDLSDQMVYVYRDGKLAYSSICVTGLASDPERATRTGCYYIKDKKEEYILVGADYETPTKFWVRIMWTGTGYHYLARSDWSRWSPEIYKTRGSHGCINLQLADAENIYNLVKMRDIVFIHE